MGKIEASRHIWQHKFGTRTRHSTVSGHFEGKIAVFSRLIGAFVRAFLVLLLIATPSVLLPVSNGDANPIVMLLAIFAAVFVFIEYYSSYPSLIEFRDAPPFNRVRFISLFLTLFLMCIIFQGQSAPSTLSRFVSAISLLIGNTIDFPFSPVNLIEQILPDNASQQDHLLIRAIAGLSYLISLLTLAVYIMLLKFQGWPSTDKPFNVWVNLPTFDPSTGSDVVSRLNRDARVNIIMGFTLPFISPIIIKMATGSFLPITLDSAQTIVWTMAAWAFLPTSLFMRGIAMRRIATMIEEKRKRANALAERAGLAFA